MADKSVGDQQKTNTDVQDERFTFGDQNAEKKIDAWDGENTPDAMDEAAEMSLANLHYGTTPDADILKSTEATEETHLDLNAATAPIGDEAANSVAEDNAGVVVATLTQFDNIAQDGTTFTVSDDRFEVADGNLRLVDGVSLDHESEPTLEITIKAFGADGNVTEESVFVEVLDINEAPTDLALDNTGVAENSAGATVGTLSSFDPDLADTVTYTVSDERFEVVDGELKLIDGVSFDHEAVDSVDVTVTATDAAGLSTEETFTIDILDVNEGPTDLELDGSAVAENATGATVGTLSAFDPDAGDTVTYSVSDDRFEVVDGELKLKDDVSLDHEEAESLDVTVTASDSEGLSTSETFTVDVTDVNEGPTDLELDGGSIAENS
ncbi:MAG: cadherin repeat domain-containing protein, partial [Pseudomonadota bacterium]